MPSLEWFNTYKTAAMLGISDKTVRKICNRGELVHRRVGRKRLISMAAIQDYIAGQLRGTVKPKPSVAIQVKKKAYVRRGLTPVKKKKDLN